MLVNKPLISSPLDLEIWVSFLNHAAFFTASDAQLEAVQSQGQLLNLLFRV